MTVYVDNMRANFGRLVMCHMIADTEAELHAMADTIGVARKWFQKKASGDHYDIALSKRALAVKAGAVEITLRQCAAMCYRRRNMGILGAPAEAIEWMQQRRPDVAA
jgi:hypothetical protein